MTDTQLSSQVTDVQTEVQKLTNAKAIIAYLAEKFPLCFVLEGENSVASGSSSIHIKLALFIWLS